MTSHARDQVQLVCEECGSVDDAGPEVVAQATGRVETSFGFQVRVVQATVFGRCAHCLSVGSE
ncbi:MAG: hypothetical protein GY939_15170 [Actinomycetia bacterium]|nr:hypothetical protein [Actinomycetes bacterium]